MVLSLNIKNEKITDKILEALKKFKSEDLEIQKVDDTQTSKQEKIDALLSITNSLDMEGKTLQQIKSEV
jgi:hypothetical protein